MFLDVDRRQAEKELTDWMLDGSEFHSSDTATGNIRQPTVVTC